MKITDFKKGQDHQLIQKLFMNIPMVEYLNYVYPRIGMEKELDTVMSVMLSLSDCNSNYIVDFDEEHLGPDKRITIGQMLKIAENMFPVNAERLYPQKDCGRAAEAAANIINGLITVPFTHMFKDLTEKAFSDGIDLSFFDEMFDGTIDDDDLPF